MSISAGEVRNAAQGFLAAARESEALVNRLEELVAGLRQDWEGPAQESFCRQYEQWRSLMQAQAALLMSISLQLRDSAERHEQADV